MGIMQNKCSVERCQRDGRAKGFCAKHYQRTRTGNPDMSPGSIAGRNKKNPKIGPEVLRGRGLSRGELSDDIKNAYGFHV